MLTQTYSSEKINKKLGNLSEIVHFIPVDFDKNLIHKKILEVLENNKEKINNSL
jgi:hypothetical protein